MLLKETRAMNRYAIRGIVYCSVSISLLSYELISQDQPRFFLLFMYAVVALFGLYLILFVSDKTKNL